MILYEVFPNKTLKILEDEKTYITENLISSVHIKLPSTFGDYPVKELTAELRFYFPEGDYMAYEVDTQQARPEVPITNDITEKPQTLSVMLFFYKGGNVIGKTNSVDKVILDAPLKGEPLTPRAEFDEVIAEQRETIAEQAETISEQATAIEAKDGQISELNDEVSALEGTVAEQQATITRQNTTIDELNERRIPVYIEPRLVPKEVTPQLTNQYIEPPEGKNGFNAILVNPITSNLVPNCEPQNIAKGKTILGVTGTFDSFPENPVGGIYFYEPDENDNPTKCKVYNCFVNSNTFNLFSNSIYSSLREIVFQNALGDNIPYMPDSIFGGYSILEKIILPTNLVKLSKNIFYNCYSLQTVILHNGLLELGHDAFWNCFALSEIHLPNSLIKLNLYSFESCTSLATINIPASLMSVASNAFIGCTSLEYVTMENGFNCNDLNLSSSTLYSAETIVSCLEALADRTGQTAYTITFGTTNLNKLTAEEKAIATNKNWNLA